jgi:hypothetical protein
MECAKRLLPRDQLPLAQLKFETIDGDRMTLASERGTSSGFEFLKSSSKLS